MFLKTILLSACLSLGSACVVNEYHSEGRTKEEQLLLSLAIERACKEIPLDILRNQRVEVRVSALANETREYLRAEIEKTLLHHEISIANSSLGLPPFYVLDLKADIAAAETRRNSLQIPIPVPFAGEQLGIPIYEKRAAQANIQLSGYLSDSRFSKLQNAITPISIRVYVSALYFFSIIGPFRSSNLDKQTLEVYLNLDG